MVNDQEMGLFLMGEKKLKFSETFKDENIVHSPMLFTVFSVLYPSFLSWILLCL